MCNGREDICGVIVRAREVLRHVFMMSERGSQMCLAAFIDVN